MNVGNDAFANYGELQERAHKAPALGRSTLADGAIFADDKATINNFVINVVLQLVPTRCLL